MVSFFVGLVVILGWLVSILDSFVRLASSSVVVVMSVRFDFVIFVFAVVLQGQPVSLRVLGFRVDELQLVLVRADLDWVRQVLLVLVLHVDWHGVVVDELHRLMRLGVFVVDVVVVLRLGGLGSGVVCRLARVLVDDARKCDGDKREQNLCEKICFRLKTAARCESSQLTAIFIIVTSARNFPSGKLKIDRCSEPV